MTLLGLEEALVTPIGLAGHLECIPTPEEPHQELETQMSLPGSSKQLSEMIFENLGK